MAGTLYYIKPSDTQETCCTKRCRETLGLTSWWLWVIRDNCSWLISYNTQGAEIEIKSMISLSGKGGQLASKGYQPINRKDISEVLSAMRVHLNKIAEL